MRLFLLLFIYFVSFGFSGQVFSQCNPPGTPTPGLGEFACLEAPLLCSISELDGYTNCTAPSGVGICPAPFCGSCENYQWFSFIATSSIVSVSITPSNCVEQPNGSGLQAHIYETVDCENFISVSNCESPSSNIPITVTSIDLEIGEKYYLMIDGWAGDECDYEIEVLEGGSLPPGGDILTISGDTSFCLTSYTMEYTVITDPDTALVNWTIDPPLGEIILGQGGNTIQVQWGFAGQAQLCADTGAECGEGEEVCIDISIELGPPIVHEHLICPGDTVFCEDLIITEPGEYVAGDTTLLTGCLSEIICAVDWAPTDTTHLGTILLCNDDCFSADTLYCEAGEYEYSILASDGCDSVIQFQIATLSSNVEILPLPDTLCPGTTLLSADTSLVLSDSTVWESELIWSGPGILGDSTQLSVEVAISGTYFISYSIRQYNSVCTVFDSINVEFDLPIIDSLAVSICEGDSVTIGNSVYAEPGMYADTLVAYSGCDSVVMLSLSVDSILYSSLESTICEGDSLFFGNEFLDSAGVYEATFISQLGCDSVVLSYEIESSFLTQTGSIYPEWGGGTPPLTFEWSSGQNTPFIENVPFANYLVTVIDSRNCFQSWGFQLGGVIGDPGIQFSSRPLKLWPNPLDEEELHLELPEGYDGPGTLELLSVHGQSVMKTEVGFAGGRGATKVGDLPAGVYFLRLQVGQDVWTERVQVF
jgi:hypothetical protein